MLTCGSISNNAVNDTRNNEVKIEVASYVKWQDNRKDKTVAASNVVSRQYAHVGVSDSSVHSQQAQVVIWLAI